jgi:hypothetical protein
MSSRSENGDDAAQRMLGAVLGAPALGRGPVPNGGFSRHDYHHPAAGWGAARSVSRVLEKAGDPIDGFHALFVMNHEDGGFDCPGCAWPDDPNGLRLDIRMRRRVHARAERPLRDRRRQHTKRAASDQAPRRRAHTHPNKSWISRFSCAALG